MNKSNKYKNETNVSRETIEPIEKIETNDDGFIVENGFTSAGIDKPALEKATEKNQTIKPERDVQKTRQRSEIDTIKRFNKWIKDLEKMKMATTEEIASLKIVSKNMTERWIGLEIKEI